MILLYRFDIYIYLVGRRTKLAPRLERKRIETVVPLIVPVYYTLYNARTIIWNIIFLKARHAHFVSLEKRNDLYPLREERKLAEMVAVLFFEKYVFPCKIFNITDSTDNLQIERACTILRLQICKYI